jgi:Fe-S-cluster-containing dehydrogenase component/formate-dependent nitrite reductase membrane component NrfD
MKYGFVIDNRKCIGCHACTTACKSEHDVPVGVFRTWVKQVEKGAFPHTRRLFSVMRCNHCTDAPCVDICPVEALYTRPDGIVDFDKNRCIGCKSCMQACPYDALYIDPDSHTAAKCNYCAHRVDIGLEPACVNVCPEHAIISGDMDNPETEIFQLLGREQVSVRKAAKGTGPNVYYIDGDEASLNPLANEKPSFTLWGTQSRGVGHFAHQTEKLAYDGDDIVKAALAANGSAVTNAEMGQLKNGIKSVDVLMGNSRRVYDTPSKGILWGWEVPAYVWTKSIAAGAFLVPFLAQAFGFALPDVFTNWAAIGLSLVFLVLTGAFLVMDLDRPDRFLNVLLRPQWGSWLVRGGYAISIYGLLLTIVAAAAFFSLDGLQQAASWLTAAVAVIVAVYTAFLFAQAKGRDFWQSPGLPLHMLIHSLMSGAAVFSLIGLFVEADADWSGYLRGMMSVMLVLNLLTLWVELSISHPTEEARLTVNMIVRGQYAGRFRWGVLLAGNLVPLALLLLPGAAVTALAAALVLAGIYITERIWVEAPQRVSLS